MDQHEYEDVGVEVVGVPRKKKRWQLSSAKAKRSTSLLQTYLVPHMETGDHAVEISLQGIPQTPSIAPRAPKTRHPAGSVLQPPSVNLNIPPALETKEEKREVDKGNNPITHISGDPFPPSFRVVGVSPSDLEEEEEKQEKLTAGDKCRDPPASNSNEKTNERDLSLSRRISVPHTINTSLNQTTSTTLTDEQEDFDEEHLAKTRDRFLQLNTSTLQKKEKVLTTEIFQDEEEGPINSGGDASVDGISHKSTTPHYLRLTQQFMEQRKERQRQEKMRLQHHKSTPSSLQNPQLPRKRTCRCLENFVPLSFCLLIVLGIGLILTIVALTQSQIFKGTSHATAATQDSSTMVDTDSNTSPPTSTTPPSFFSNIHHNGPLLLTDFPAATKLVLSSNDQNAPQVKAYQWLLDDPSMGNYPKWQQIQRMALAILYYSTNGQKWKYASNWLSYELPECQWYSQACDSNGHIRRLLLADSNLDGTLPIETFWLTSLQQIQLYDNPNLQGSIPTEIGMLTELQVLWVQNCQLRAPFNPAIPSEVGLLADTLLYMDLSGNPLGQQNRTVDSARDNDIGSSTLRDTKNCLPTEMGLLSNLQELILSDCHLTGTLFSEIGNLQQLEYSLQLQRNEFYGSLPSQLGNLQKLEHFYANDNQFSGTLPSEMMRWTNLKIFDVSENHIEGRLPEEWGMQMDSVEEFWLYDNMLTGPIPEQWGQLSNSLRSLDLSVNQLSQGLPTELCELTDLTGLWLYQNTLQFEIPSCIGNLHQNLLQLSLFRNNLSGWIPSDMSRLTKLRGLWLDDNQLTGPVPPQLLGLTNLVSLHLFSNGLQGTLPRISSQPYYALQDLRLQSNLLTGTLPDSLGYLSSNLQWLHLNQNEFWGTIPFGFTKLTKLLELNLQDNELTGSVRDEICELKESASGMMSILVDCDDLLCDCCTCPT